MVGNLSPKNVSIEKPKRVRVEHNFLLKYKSEEQRQKFADMIIKLVKTHELHEFHIEEVKAFEMVRIIYNNHTLIAGESFSFSDLERAFLLELKREH